VFEPKKAVVRRLCAKKKLRAADKLMLKKPSK